MRAITMASMNRSGGLTAGPANKSFFYAAIQHRQRSAFQPFGASAPDWTKFDAADYPWALPEPVFRALDAEVSQGKGLAGEKAISWDDVLKTVSDYKKEIGLGGPAAWFGKKVFKTFLTKYAPELAEGAIAEWGAGVAALGAFGLVRLQQIIVPISNAQTKRMFEIDRHRRDYDRAMSGAMVSK